MRLTGKRIVNTRAAHQAEALNRLLRAEGALPLEYPAIAIAPPEDTQVLDAALAQTYDLLVLTSANTVESLMTRLQALGVSVRGWPAAVVGEATAQLAAEKLGVEIAFMPSEANAKALGEELAVRRGMRILLPQSEMAGAALAETLREKDAEVNAVTAYRTVRGKGGEIAPLLRAGQVDAVTFTSASTVHYFAEQLREEGVDLPESVRVVCLSRQVSEAARAEGYPVSAAAEIPTLTALVEALATTFM